MQWLRFFCLFLSLTASVRAAALPVEQIVAKALEKSEADEKNLTRFEYLQKVTFESLDSDGKPKEDGVSHLEMKVLPGEQTEFVVIGSGGKVTEEQQKQARLSQKYKATFSLRKLEPRFLVRLDGTESWNGRPVLRLAFSPKPDQPYTNRVEKIANHLAGFMWLDAADYTLLRAKAHLAEPVAMAWILASMESLNFAYEGCAVPGGSSSSSFEIDYRVAVLVGQLRQRNEITMTDYREKVPTPTASQVSPMSQ